MSSLKSEGVSVCLTNLQWPITIDSAIELDEVRISATNLITDPDDLLGGLSGTAKILAKISEENLFDFLSKGVSGAESISSISLTPDGITVHFELAIGFAKAAGSVLCEPSIVLSNKLEVTVLQAKFLGVGASTIAKNFVKGINPILDFSQLPFEVVFTSVKTFAGYATLEMTVTK